MKLLSQFQGTFGNPLMDENKGKVYGISSYCGGYSAPAVYTDVAAYKDYISEELYYFKKHPDRKGQHPRVSFKYYDYDGENWSIFGWFSDVIEETIDSINQIFGGNNDSDEYDSYDDEDEDEEDDDDWWNIFG